MMIPRIELRALQPALAKGCPSTIQLLVRLHAPRPESAQRPPLNLGLCIDRSGSMGGIPMEQAIAAGCHVVEQLKDEDRISAVAFQSIVEVPVSARPARDRPALIAELKKLTAGGGTNLFQGWLSSCAQVGEGTAPGRLSRVLLLSDGGANEGETDPLRIADEVARWQARGITTTTIGLGAHYQEDLMAAMARAGNGNFYHVQTPQEMVTIFQVEMLGLSSTFGQAVSLGIQPRAGVQLSRVYNLLDPTPKGRLKLGDLVHGCPLDVVVELQVEPQVRSRDLCSFRLAWTEVEKGRRYHSEVVLQLPVVPAGALAEFPVDTEVAQQRAIKLSARLLSEAISQIDAKDREGARQTLARALSCLGECEQGPEIQQTRAQIQRLKAQLESGDVGGARKAARYSSVSSSVSSIVLHRGIREFLALPIEERTPEKFEEIRRMLES